MTNEEIIKKTFVNTEDNRLVVKAPFVRVKLLQDFFNHKIAELNGSEVSTIGIMYIEVFGLDDKEFDIDNLKNPHIILFKMPMQVILCPSEIEEGRDENKNLVTILNFQEGDTFIKSTLFVRTWKTVSKLIDLMLKGFLPKELAYDKVMNFISAACEENKTNTQIADTIMEIMIAELSRSPYNLAIPFRLALKENPKLKMTDKQYIKVDSSGRMYNSFAAISSGDPKQGISMSIVRKRYNESQKESTIEEALSDV